jgi:uncharacterized SAM-binding protein YcdF (DUF218 family)
MFFALKKLVGFLAEPLSLALLLALFALALAVLRRRRAARWVGVACVVFLYLCATPLVGRLLCAPLEHRFPPLHEADVPAGLGYILVLGSSYRPHDAVPVTAALDSEGLTRVVEGVRLHRQLAVPKLILSGGGAGGAAGPAEGYRILARSLGVDDAAIITLTAPLDTTGEAQALVGRIGSEPFILVTSATHMPRAVELMRRAGARPIPAPTAQRVTSESMQVLAWLPQTSGLAATSSALHEYLGLLALRVGMQ